MNQALDSDKSHPSMKNLKAIFLVRPQGVVSSVRLTSSK